MIGKSAMALRLLTLIIVILMPAAALAGDVKPATSGIEEPLSQDESRPFYATWDQPGWWWGDYKPDGKPKDDKKEKKEARTPVIPPSLSAFTYERLWNMHPDAFQELLMNYQKKAVMTPSEDNVRDYYIMQDIARRKSMAFTNVAMMVWQKNPDLFVLKDYPNNNQGMASKTRQQNRDMESKIRNNLDNFALVYFYSATCDYCAEQAKILQFFVDKYGWQIKKVEINANPGLAARFNVENVPMILMIHRNSQDYMPVTAGLATLNEIEENLYRGIRLMNREVTPEQYSQYDFQDHSAFNPQLLMNKEDAIPGRRARTEGGIP
jgi:conjugal transfer pilus assembly protein TraF